MEKDPYEHGPGYDAEHPGSTGELEKLGKELGEKLRSGKEEEFGRRFEAPLKFDNEDEKSRVAEREADERALQAEIDEQTAQISQAVSVLATLPLTPEQQALLTIINQLIDERSRTQDPRAHAELDSRIDATTQQLADLPVTTEQGALLDDILRLMDEREKTTLRLQYLYASHNSR